MKRILVLLVSVCVIQTVAAQRYYTGNGGKGLTIAVLSINGAGLDGGDDAVLQRMIQDCLTADFQQYSAMTVVDRANVDKVLAEQDLAKTGYYSETEYIRVGRLVNARSIVTGTLRRTGGSYTLSLSVTAVESGRSQAAFNKTGYNFDAIRYLTGVKEASADLLAQLGVALTDEGRTALQGARREEANALELMAKADELMRANPMSVEAMAMLEQAKILDPRLAPKIREMTAQTVNIHTGNAGNDLRADVAWRKSWIARLTEAEKYFSDFFKTYKPPYTIYYSTALNWGATDYENGTLPVSFDIRVAEAADWTQIVTRTVNAVKNDLDGTNRSSIWGLDNWPSTTVFWSNSFQNGSKDFTVIVELLNDSGKSLGRQTISLMTNWTITTGSVTTMTSKITIGYVRTSLTVTFPSVNAYDIDEKTTIRWVSVNGVPVKEYDNEITFIPEGGK